MRIERLFAAFLLVVESTSVGVWFFSNDSYMVRLALWIALGGFAIGFIPILISFGLAIADAVSNYRKGDGQK